VLLVCLIFSPFVLIPAFSGSVQRWLYGYIFVLQYGAIGVISGILLFEIDQIRRARKLRFLTSWISKVAMIFPAIYLFFYLARNFVQNSESVDSSLELASIFGVVSQSDLDFAKYIGSYFHLTGAFISLVIVLLCLSILTLNKYRAFKEVQRI